MKNYYDILEIPFTASKQEIEQAYKKLSVKYHPDNNGGVSFFNKVYQDIQEAYNTLTDETSKAEYNRLNNINISGSLSSQPTAIIESPGDNVNITSKSRKQDLDFSKILTYLLTAGCLLGIGYFVYANFVKGSKENPVDIAKNELAFDPLNSNEDNVRKLLEAENTRDFDVIITFYSGDLERYWESTDIKNKDLKSQYEKAWQESSYSRKNIQNIEKIAKNILHVTTEFTFTNTLTNHTITNINLNKYIFNNYGLITHVYNIDPVKELPAHQDNRLVRKPESTKLPENKIIKSPEIVKTGPVKNNPINDDEITDIPFAVIDEVPVFPGCEESINNEARKKCMSEKVQEFVTRRFNTDLGSQLGLSGINRVIVVFKIDKEGTISGVRARAPHPRLEQEAARVINLLPQMQPGKQGGKAIGVSYSLPIVFNVQD